MRKTTFLAVILLMVFLTFTTSCKSKDDDFSILGNWTINMLYSGNYNYDGGIITFAGSLASGSVSIRFPPDTQVGTGTFTVNGSVVTFTIYWPSAEYTDTCIGTVLDDNSMSGTLVEQPGNTPGTWNCNR